MDSNTPTHFGVHKAGFSPEDGGGLEVKHRSFSMKGDIAFNIWTSNPTVLAYHNCRGYLSFLHRYVLYDLMYLYARSCGMIVFFSEFPHDLT